MSTVQVKQGTVIFRHWDTHDGLNEIARRFNSLDELFGLCLQKEESLLVDRVIIDGADETDAPRTVTLVFQSVTIAPAQEFGLMQRRSIPYLAAINITTFGLTLWSNVTNPNLYQYKLEHLIAHESVNTLLGLYAIGGLLTATIAQPLLGLMSDRTHSRFGRRAPYLVVGAVGVVVALLAIAGAASIGALFGAILFGQVASNAIQGPWQALSPDSVPDSAKRRVRRNQDNF